MKLADLLKTWVKTNIPTCEISELQNDSRKVKAGCLFCAYPGAAADGRLLIHQAIQAGAAAIAYDPAAFPSSVVLPNTLPCLPVPNLDVQLAGIASRFYGYPSKSISLTGVTGTNGKTTIAYQLTQAYEHLGHASAYIGTLGHGSAQQLEPLVNTTPDALCLQHLIFTYKEQAIQHVCMEVSSHALSQKRVADLEFTQAIYTNLSHEHLDYHLTMQAYAQAKAELLSWPSLTSVIINLDDEWASFMIANMPTTCKKISYGLNKGSDVRGHNLKMSIKGSQFDVDSPWGPLHIQSKVLGAFNVYNSLAVLSGLLAREIEVNKAVDVMQKLNGAPGRMEVVSLEPCIIVDYAHTPDALKNVLSALVKLKQGKLIVVFGCGGDRDKAKRPMMGRIAAEYADVVIITSDNPRTENPAQIIEQIAKGVPASVKPIMIHDREGAIIRSLSLANSNDIILIAGKGHEAYQQIGKERLTFSDQAVVRKLLNETYI